MDELPKDEAPVDDAMPLEDLLAANEAELQGYRRELARQLNASVDALAANFDEALPIATTIRQSRRGLRRLAQDAKERAQYFEWWAFVTDGGRLKPRTWLGRRWFAWQYWLFAFRRRHRLYGRRR
jgi:hypothetical protein